MTIKILDTIGAGNWGCVFSGTCNDSPRAVKIPGFETKHLVASIKEAKALKKCAGLAHIIQIREEERKNICDHLFTMDLLKCNDLFTICERESLPLQTCLSIIRQLLESLQGLKSKGIIHGDLSLANILYHKKSNLVTLIDLGFSVTDNGDHKGLLLYTKRYRPPEVVLEKIPYRTDVDMWALGCILYQLITNKDLFEVDPNTPDFDLMAKIVNQCGGPPSLTYLEGCRHASRYFSAEGKSLNQFPKKERWKEEIKKCVENTTTASSLIAFLGKIFTYEDRISVEEALNDPLFTTCLQEEILHFTVDEPELRHNHLYILDPETKKRLRKVHLSLAPHADYCIHVPKQNSYLCTIKKPDKTELLSFQITSTTVSEEKEKES